MKPDSRYKCIRYFLLLLTSIRLCIGLLVVSLTLHHLYLIPAADVVDDEPESQIEASESSNRSRTTTFDVIMNGTDEFPEKMVHPEAALLASVCVIILSIIGLIGLVRQHIVWILAFGLFSTLFLVLRVYVLIRTIFLGACMTGDGCVRDEVLNTVIGLVEIILTFRLAYEMRSRREQLPNVGQEDMVGVVVGRTRVIVNRHSSLDDNKNVNTNTDVEELETSNRRTSSPKQSLTLTLFGSGKTHQQDKRPVSCDCSRDSGQQSPSTSSYLHLQSC